MNNKKLISIDLELEQPRSGPQTPDSKLSVSKIIQLGWVVFETTDDGGINILREQRHYINIGVPLSSFIKKLTHITDDQISSGGTLLDAYGELIKDQKEFNTVRVVRQWGGGDMGHLRMELENETKMNELNDFNYKWEFGNSGFNVKHLYQAYALTNDMNTSGGLSKCMARCGVIWSGSGKHDALIDAINTAKFYGHLENKLKEK